MMVLMAAATAALCAAVGGERIVARDMARVWPAFAAVEGGTVLGYAPALGARRLFGPAELARLAARFGVAGEPSRVCFERAAAPLDRQGVLAAMRAALGVPEARIAIVELSAYPVPQGEIAFPRQGLSIPGPAAPPGTPVPWRGEVRYGAGRRFRIWARVTLTAAVVQVRAIEPLRAGVTIRAEQLRLETAEVFPVGGRQAQSIQKVAGRRPRRLIAAGAVVSLDLLDEVPDVAPGDAVQIEVISGAARLSLEGRAESAGRRGQTVRVRNPATRRAFTARVSGKGAVVVQAGGTR